MGNTLNGWLHIRVVPVVVNSLLAGVHNSRRRACGKVGNAGWMTAPDPRLGAFSTFPAGHEFMCSSVSAIDLVIGFIPAPEEHGAQIDGPDPVVDFFEPHGLGA